MNKLMTVVGSTIGGYLGWWAGAFVGTMTAFMSSVVMTGVGIYVSRRVMQRYF